MALLISYQISQQNSRNTWLQSTWSNNHFWKAARKNYEFKVSNFPPPPLPSWSEIEIVVCLEVVVMVTPEQLWQRSNNWIWKFMIFGSLSPGTNQNIITKLQNKSANRCCHCKNIPGNVFRPRRTTKKNYAYLTRRTPPPTHTAAYQINYTITCSPCARVNETWIYQFTLE